MARPVIKAECVTTEHADGRQDVTVKVPLIQLKPQVSEAQWEKLKLKLLETKYGPVKEKILGDDTKPEKERQADWESFVDALVNEKYRIRAKTLEDAKNRAYRIAEKYGAHLELKETSN